MQDVLTVILAGGKGTRLEPLTRDRAKPAVPFGGAYRIIDFALSNCLNSNLRRILVLTQYKARSLDRHIRQGWGLFRPELGEAIEVLPPQQRAAIEWYSGTADAMYQNIYSLEKEEKLYTLILAGDHIYKMDYAELILSHQQAQADLTIGCIPIPLHECDQFGIMQVDESNRVIGFQEKPKTTTGLPHDPDRCLGSMGIYVFNTRLMFELLVDDAGDQHSQHDFGKDIIPKMLESHRVFAFPFRDKNRKSEAYWRDVGTLDAYYQANIDLIEVDPILNLYDRDWPIRTLHSTSPPPKFVFNGEGSPGSARRGEALDSMICPGCIISGGHVSKSILSPNVRVNSYASVTESILFDGVDIGRHSRIHRCIIDKEVKIPPNTTIGLNHDDDRARGLTISENGVVIIAKATRFDW